MAGLRDACIDGLALMVVGSGLTAAALSYVRAIPEPAARSASAWEEPVTTGSIAPHGRASSEAPDEAADLWTDPPPRPAGSPAHGPF